MNKISLALAFTLFLTSLSFSAHAKRERVVLCVDRGYWYPFVFINSYRPDGLYVDIAKDAADRLNWRISIRPMDWKKCLRQVETGHIDGILGASYKAKRAEFMYYPEGAEKKGRTPARLSTAEYVVVTPTNSNYRFDGNVKSIPQPLRVPRGYSVADDLKKAGVTVDTKSRGDEVTLMKMATSKDGAVVTLRSVAEKYSKSPAFSGKITIQNKAYKSKDYFLTISKASNMSEEKRNALWSAIAAVTEDTALVAEYQSKY